MNPTSSPPSTALVRVRIWDLPTRLFHWLLALAVSGAVVSAKIGGNAMVWHSRLGLAVLALLAFRLVWGFIGPAPARFSSFLRGPKAGAFRIDISAAIFTEMFLSMVYGIVDAERRGRAASATSVQTLELMFLDGAAAPAR